MTKLYLIVVTTAVFVSFIKSQPVRKIVVAKDGTGNYTTVQQAFDAIPLNNVIPVEVFIKNGVYKEKLRLDSSKNFVTVKGEDKNNTILTYDDHTGKISPTGETINTMSSQSIYIRGNDFRAENITFENNAGITAGQAVAV